MQAERLDELEADREAGVQAGRRLLEDHGHVLAGELAALAVGHGQKIAAGKGEAVGADAARIGDKAHQSQHGDALAGAGFADDAEHLPLLQPEADAVDGAHNAGGGGKLDGEVLDLEEGHRHSVMVGPEAPSWSGLTRPSCAAESAVRS